MRCPGSVALEMNIPDTTSAYAEEGTRAHELAADFLAAGDISDDAWARFLEDDVNRWVSQEMAHAVCDYVDYVKREAEGNLLLVEQRVDFSDVIGVPDSFGTSDAVVIAGDLIKIIDLKYGMGVRVEAEENEQLQLYALGALENYALLGEFKTVKMAIVQPRLDHISEWQISVEDLRAFGGRARDAALDAMELTRRVVSRDDLAPGEKQCKFCKAKAICPALAEFVQATVDADFENLDADEIKTAPMGMGPNYLGVALAAVPLIEDWCKAVRAKAESELLAGRPVTGFKLVRGRNGQRRWGDEARAAEILEQHLGKAAFDTSLISPAAAEKKLKGSKTAWAEVRGVITQKEGPPSVAPETDKRPAWSPADDFDIITEEN